MSEDERTRVKLKVLEGLHLKSHRATDEHAITETTERLHMMARCHEPYIKEGLSEVAVLEILNALSIVAASLIVTAESRYPDFPVVAVWGELFGHQIDNCRKSVAEDGGTPHEQPFRTAQNKKFN
jgi:hypothetical protein